MTDTNTLEREVVFHRYYDPITAQFLSVDPLVDQTGQPYSYAGDNPINGSDPVGLCSGPDGMCRDVNQPGSQYNPTTSYVPTDYGNDVQYGPPAPAPVSGSPAPSAPLSTSQPVTLVPRGFTSESSLNLNIEAPGNGFWLGIGNFLEVPDTSFNICPKDAYRSQGCQGATLLFKHAFVSYVPISDRSGWSPNEIPTYTISVTATVDPLLEFAGSIAGVESYTPDPQYELFTSLNVSQFANQ